LKVTLQAHADEVAWAPRPMADVALAATDVPRVAFLGFQLINTSIEPTTPVEDHRILMLNDLFLQELAASGRFKVVTIPADLSQEIATNADIANCNGCERNYAQRVGADWAAWGTVQKVSNLILNIRLSGSVSIHCLKGKEAPPG
jgi:hypothetical protein